VDEEHADAVLYGGRRLVDIALEVPPSADAEDDAFADVHSVLDGCGHGGAPRALVSGMYAVAEGGGNNLYRLTSVTFPGSRTVSYTFDAFGNRTSMTA
jgi:YD repeat-containing protein